MGARKLYEEQIMQLVHEVSEEKLPGILAHLKGEFAELPQKIKTKEEMLESIEKGLGLLKGQLSSVDEFMKWKQEEKKLERW
jgi:hypothetical protein